MVEPGRTRVSALQARGRYAWALRKGTSHEPPSLRSSELAFAADIEPQRVGKDCAAGIGDQSPSV
jgi:hypothetical protein